MSLSTLSVHMSNYNDSSTIGEALEAICTQSHQPDEVIVIDDGSTDNSIEVIQEYVRRFPIIRLERNDTNRGVVYTINSGLRLARGKFIYFASANDRILPGFFEKSMKLLAQHPQAKMCFTDGLSINANTGKKMEDGRKGYLAESGFLSGKQIAQKLQGISMHGVSYITNRDLMIKMGGYPAELKWHCDFFLHHMIAFRFGACYIPEELVVWICSPGSGYSSGMGDLEQQRQIFLKMQKLIYGAEFRDLIPAVIRGKFLNTFRPVMSISSVLEGLEGVNYWKSPVAVLRLAQHLLWEAGKLSIPGMKREIGWKIHVANGFIVNRWEQIFACSFHEYDRLRRSIRGRANRRQARKISSAADENGIKDKTSV